MPRTTIVATHRARQPQKEWHDYLDEAIERKFPVLASTEPHGKAWATKIATKTGKPLMPALRKRIDAFVAGFMACEETY